MLKRKSFSLISLSVVLLLLEVLVAPAQIRDTSARKLTAQEQLARDLLQELIETDTTHSSGNTTKAAEAMRARLRAAGFPEADIQVIGPRPDRSNLVARLRGTGSQKPILLLAHLDVVEARREDWSVDPFKFLERDGYFYGRGTSDIKNGAASLVANLIRLKREGFKPDRDIILALTADEEEGDANGVDWLLKNHRELIDAAYCINTDAGDGQIKNGKRMRVTVQTSEKVYQDFQLEVKNRGGHSSLPVKDNAIYHLAEGLSRLAKFEFPVKLNETTRLYFERVAESETAEVAADMRALARNPTDAGAVARLSASPFYNAVMRTTCVATMLDAGHAPNALPQTAKANVNCRLLPEDSPAEVRQTLVKVLVDDQITVTPINEPTPSPASPLVPAVLQPIEKVSAGMWPGIAVVPIMETGASDGLFFRRAGVPVYGISGMFFDIDDVRAHGKDERIGVQSYYEGVEFMYRLLKALTSGK